MGANMRRTANGDVDILHAIGGWRGLVESSLPAVAFLVLFTVTKELNLSPDCRVGRGGRVHADSSGTGL